MAPKSIIGLAWYRREDYPRVLEVMSDDHLLPATYDRWEERAQQAERQQIALGRIVHRAYIDPQEFAAWCALTDRDVDAHARLAWANAAAFRHGAGSH